AVNVASLHVTRINVDHCIGVAATMLRLLAHLAPEKCCQIIDILHIVTGFTIPMPSRQHTKMAVDHALAVVFREKIHVIPCIVYLPQLAEYIMHELGRPKMRSRIGPKADFTELLHKTSPAKLADTVSHKKCVVAEYLGEIIKMAHTHNAHFVGVVNG